MLFYATRLDKTGNKLVTSYANQKSCDKFGGADSTQYQGIYYANISKTGAKVGEDVGGLVMRSMLVNNGSVASEAGGRFVLYGKVGGEWSRTPFAFSSYGTANTAMKALIANYQAIIIVDEDNEVPTAKSSGMNSELEITGEI